MRVYKIIVDRWPTEDGKPWPRFIEGPGGGGYHGGEPHIDDDACAWFNALTDETKARFSAGDAIIDWDYGSHNAGPLGWILPNTKRRHYLARASADRWVVKARLLGADARVEPSDPITWPGDQP